MKEVWKDIEGYEGLYKISNLGRVKSLIKNIILKNRPNGNGYNRVGLSIKLGKSWKKITEGSL